MIVTEVVAVTEAHPFAAAMKYVTVYVPGVLDEGVIEPVEASIVNPAVELNVPPVVPVTVTGCGVVLLLQKGCA